MAETPIIFHSLVPLGLEEIIRKKKSERKRNQSSHNDNFAVYQRLKQR